MSQKRKAQKQVDEYDYEAFHLPYETFDRNITQLCSSLDLSSVYHPPSTLLLPGDSSKPRQASVSGSGSGSDSESSASSGAEEASKSRRESKGSRKSSTHVSESMQHEQKQRESPVPTTAPVSAAAAAEVSSQMSPATPTTPQPNQSREHPMRQGSFGQGSILGQIASQAKELVKETKRQSSQEGLLSQVDKVN